MTTQVKKEKIQLLNHLYIHVHALPVVLGEVLNVAAGLLLEDVVGVYKKRNIPIMKANMRAIISQEECTERDN